MKTAARYMSNLSFWWASTSTDYYLSYLDSIKSVSLKDIQIFTNKYLKTKNFLTSIWINSEDNKEYRILEKVSQITKKGGAK